MFLWATLIIAPFTIPHMLTTEWSAVTTLSWWEAAYVVVFGTFIGYILTMIGQRTLRPTVVSTYNYVQPIVSVTVSIITGIGIFQWSQALAVVLVFTGVWWVTKSKSRRDMEREKGLS